MDGIVSVSSAEKIWGSSCEGTVGGSMVGVDDEVSFCGVDEGTGVGLSLVS
jgi:hypothetical protein